MAKSQSKQDQQEEIKKTEESKHAEKQDFAKQYEEEKKRAEEFKNSYLRALADYKNLEHRINSERQSMRDTVKKEVIEKFLPILDNINQAELFTNDSGLKMVSKAFTQALNDLGVTEIDLLGNEFDPHLAEAVEAVEGKLDNIIVEVLQNAYAMNGQVIRHGRVKVSRVSQKS